MLGTLLGFTLLLSCQNADGQQTAADGNAASPVLLTAEECEAMINDAPEGSLQILDVRTPKEWNSGHLSLAMHMDFMQRNTFNEAVHELDKDQPVVVYCAVGGRSAAAAQFLSEQGFTKVYDMRGGVNAWREAGKKLVN